MASSLLDLDSLRRPVVEVAIDGTKYPLSPGSIGDISAMEPARRDFAAANESGDLLASGDALVAMLRVVTPSAPEEVLRRLTYAQANQLITYWNETQVEPAIAEHAEAAEVAKDPQSPR